MDIEAADLYGFASHPLITKKEHNLRLFNSFKCIRDSI